jgi:CelD/BcsL family acetyltransferase involved in cellulose biosynthesis
LEALRRTYGYEPVVFTDSGPGEPLRNALLFCRVESRLTGDRLVAVPFSDHCEPLVDAPEALDALLEALKVFVGRNCRYIELRPIKAIVDVQGYTQSEVFCAHSIDLRPELAAIFARFHQSHGRRAVRKAMRSGLSLEVGAANLLEDFYELHKMTRRRLGAPVQPFSWFRNLVDCMGDRLTIYMSRHVGRAAATILTIRHKSTLVFKYGCLDATYKRFGGTPHLFWKAIEDAKAQGLTSFDLGRSEVDNAGLLAFKDHLGASRTTMRYYRYAEQTRPQWWPSVASAVFAVTPANLQATLSARLYKHFG